MNKKLLTVNIVVLAVVLFFYTGCVKPVEKDGIIEIKEKMFIAQVNDVYINPDDYLGKTIKLEGIFLEEVFEDSVEPLRFVLRYGPGCCGNDGNVGFEVAWNSDKEKTYPESNSWVEAVGEIKSYNYDDFQYLYIELASLNVKSTRGEEYVSQ